jgi:hypothetical protein
MNGSLWGSFCKAGDAVAGVIGDGANAATRFAQTTAEGLKEVTTTVTQCAETMADGLQSVATQLNSGPKQSHVLEQLGESLAHCALSGKDSPSTEDFLKAINIVLPQYQQDMSTIITDVKGRLESCFEYATTTQFETKSDSSPVAHNPIKNQLPKTSKDTTWKTTQWGAVLGAIGGGFAGGPGGALAGAAIGTVTGATTETGYHLLSQIFDEAKTQSIIRKAEMEK